MSASGKQDMEFPALGQAGNPGDVATSSKEEGTETLGATALGVEKPKETGTKPRRKLPVPTSIVEENKKNLQQQKKNKPANLKIQKEKNSKEIIIEDIKMKQPTLKEFAQITQKKVDDKEVMEEENFFNQKDLKTNLGMRHHLRYSMGSAIWKRDSIWPSRRTTKSGRP